MLAGCFGKQMLRDRNATDLLEGIAQERSKGKGGNWEEKASDCVILERKRDWVEGLRPHHNADSANQFADPADQPNWEFQGKGT